MQMPDAAELAFTYGLALEVGTGFFPSTFPRQQNQNQNGWKQGKWVNRDHPLMNKLDRVGAAQEERKALGYLGPSPESLTQSHGADGA